MTSTRRQSKYDKQFNGCRKSRMLMVAEADMKWARPPEPISQQRQQALKNQLISVALFHASILKQKKISFPVTDHM